MTPLYIYRVCINLGLVECFKFSSLITNVTWKKKTNIKKNYICWLNSTMRVIALCVDSRNTVVVFFCFLKCGPYLNFDVQHCLDLWGEENQHAGLIFYTFQVNWMHSFRGANSLKELKGMWARAESSLFWKQAGMHHPWWGFVSVHVHKVKHNCMHVCDREVSAIQTFVVVQVRLDCVYYLS